MVHAFVDSLIRVPEAALPAKALARLHRALSFPNPAFDKLARLGKWTGANSEELCLLERDAQGNYTLPRGAVAQLREAIAAAGESLSFTDRRTRHQRAPFTFAWQLRDYQEEAVRALVRATQGTALLPCGAGKTVIGTAAIARCGQPSLVVVHTHDLLAQWAATLKDALGREAGVIADGSCAPGLVTVATVQSLAALNPDARRELLARFGTLVLDECHHAPASTFRDVIAACPAFFRFGLTATPQREDGLTPMLDFTFGPSAFAIDHARLVDAGHLVVPEIVSVRTGIAPDAGDHGELIAALVRDETRNRRVVDLVMEATNAGHATLVLTARVEHAEHLAAALGEYGVPVAALTGSTPKAHRAAILEAFRAGELRALCATSLADEGLDVASLSRLVLATPARAEGRTIQRLGRLMRPHPGKGTPVLYDLVDEHPLARRQHAARLRAYRKVLGESATTSTIAWSAS
jgi:superfamily II DNA or RNA helicase